MGEPTNTDLAAALREIADTLPLGSQLIVRLAADRLSTGANADGWIGWDGSQYDPDTDEPFNPVPKGTILDVRFRDGEIYKKVESGVTLYGRARDAAGPFWENEGEPNDIVAYRIVK